jgi:hypothetical protein
MVIVLYYSELAGSDKFGGVNAIEGAERRNGA